MLKNIFEKLKNINGQVQNYNIKLVLNNLGNIAERKFLHVKIRTLILSKNFTIQFQI